MDIKTQNLLTLTLLTVTLFVTGCSKIISQDAESSCTFVQNKNKQRVSWKSDLPLKFRVHKDVPAEAHESLRQAAAKWNIISTQNVIEFVEWGVSGTPESGYGNRAPTIYWLNTWESDRSTEQARTTVVWTGDKIKDADIRINDKDFDFSYDGEDFSGAKVDLISLMVHEFGHALGFAHSDEKDSVMYPLLAKGTDRRDVGHLSDLESYSCEYGESIVEPKVLAAATSLETQEEDIDTQAQAETGLTAVPPSDVAEAEEGVEATNASSI